MYDWALYSPDQASGSGPVLSVEQANQMAQETPTVVMGSSSGLPVSLPVPNQPQPCPSSPDDRQARLFTA